MAEATGRLWRLCHAHADAVAAVLLASLSAVIVGAAGLLREAPLESICEIGAMALLAWRRQRPIAVALVAAALIAAPEFTHYAREINDSALGISGLAALFLYSYALGADSPWRRSLVGLIPLGVAVGLTTDAFNPLVVVLSAGPWFGGLVIASRRQAEAQLALRARELEEEREVFAVQSVRYERARIAREIHDIVAHCVSLMVVQANAGERLTPTDPAGAAEAFDSISEAARQAEVEIERLVELLGDPLPRTSSAGLRIVEELVQRAQASGLTIACQFIGETDSLSDDSADAAYRLVQEGVTNAMKHAPGAAIEISVRGHRDAIEVCVSNGPPRTVSGLERAGGGHGLVGMRERVIRCGGVFNAESLPDGGWSVTGRLPRLRQPSIAGNAAAESPCTGAGNAAAESPCTIAGNAAAESPCTGAGIGAAESPFAGRGGPEPAEAPPTAPRGT